MTTLETFLSAVMLAGVIWAVTFLLPRARREHDGFSIVCSLLFALISLLGFFFVGIGIGFR